MPVRESGTLVKTPSIFLKNIAFVNEFEMQNGVCVPIAHRMPRGHAVVGRADLNIHFSNFTTQEMRKKPDAAITRTTPKSQPILISMKNLIL